MCNSEIVLWVLYVFLLNLSLTVEIGAYLLVLYLLLSNLLEMVNKRYSDETCVLEVELEVRVQEVKEWTRSSVWKCN